MRAVVCRELGPPETLTIEESDDPTAGPGQIVIGVEASGVNFVDALFVAGEYQIKPPLPFTPGSDVAGRITEVGEGVEGLAVGDAVAAMAGLGGYASHVVLPATSALRVPDGVPAPARSSAARST